MKILSFDVGIKNLSFCIINDTVIEDWGILNICTDDICDHCFKDGKQCDKSAKFVDKDGFKVCPGHSKLKSYSDKKFKKVSKKNNPMLDQGKCIVENLQKKDNFLDVDLVVIENQPALKNPTMKSIQMMIYSYFLINGVCNISSKIENIEMINARNKLKAYKGPVVPCIIKDKYKKHVLRKKISDHPKYIQNRILNINENEFGYDAFGLKSTTRRSLRDYIKGYKEIYF